ncbi:MAG TPA: cysteine--tRNA ligase [candidate division Zixibacteria bacterium]|nr:cysteine--tRNA ligase [candidate division Zixibacteria bacterium]
MESQSGNIRFFNSLTREKEKFVPIEKGKVKMYTCGLTVYDFGHIGNYRAFIFEDLLRRWLEYRGFKVTQVMNLTDVDDKTIRASRKNGVPLKEYTERYTRAFFEDVVTLNIEKAEFYPKATEHVPEMVALITKLMEKGYAYKGKDGSIYYEISKFKDYGKLANIKVENLKLGARVKADEYAKEQAQDFALWKAWSEEDGDAFWETPFGKGRPGWHIECSAMSMKYLGETLDIHCGGVDNLFPHHENEIAQSEAATGKKFVSYWLHNEHLLIEGKRMAKSLGNYYTLRDLTAKGYDPKAIRYLLLATHYRQQVNFTFEGLEAAKKTLDRLTNFVHRLLEADGKPSEDQLRPLISRVQNGFETAMDDDLSISEALASLFDFIRDVNILLNENSLSKDEAQEVYNLIVKFDKVLGVIGEITKEQRLPKEAEELILKREEARRAKDWKTADAIRQQLKDMDILIEDTSQGVKWRIEKH